MDYRTVFDITEVGYKSWNFPATGLIFIAIGAVLILLRKRLPSWWGKYLNFNNVITFFYFGFALLLTIVTFFDTYSEYASLKKAKARGQVCVVEGVVHSFIPMPVTGHAMERFCVQGNCFEYSDFVITSGFNNTSSHGGPIRNGLPVRVSFVGGKIVKLEVAK